MRRLLLASLALLTMALHNVHAEYPPTPSFNLPTASGHIQPSDLKGKVVYIDFWASWCKPCKKSFPWLNSVHSKYKDKGFEVLAINLDKDKNQADKFLQHIPAQFTVAFDQQGKSAESFHVQGMPSSYLIDRKGRLRARHIGFRDKDRAKLENAIEKLLKE